MKAQYLEAKIKRLEREIAEIDDFFYKPEAGRERSHYAYLLERKRDDIVRSTVLHLHTVIEDLLNVLIIQRVIGVTRGKRGITLSGTRGRGLRKMLFDRGSLGFDMKISMAVAVGLLINAKTRERLAELNTLRNKCSHNWLIRARVRRGKRPAQKKPPLLQYQGRDLHQISALKEFYVEYNHIFADLFLTNWRPRRRIR